MEFVPRVEVSVFDIVSISHEARLFYSENQFVMIRGFRFFAFFLRVIKVSVESLNIICKLSNQCSRPDSGHDYQYGVSGCKLQMRTEIQTGLLCWEAEFLAHSRNLKVMNTDVANAVIFGVNTCFCICFSRL